MSQSGITVHIKGPSALKLALTVTLDMTVLQLKERIEQENADFPAASQRLIYTGKVLKDPETLESYKLTDGHTIHMVKAAVPGGASAKSAPAASATPAASGAASAAQGVPTNLSAGQQFANNPLSALNRADYAGPHMASLMNDAGGLFGNFGGMNPRDPNVMLGMMQNPEFLRHMRDMLGRPEVIDQIIASNPQMQAMGPQMREMLRSEHFREMITNPEAIQQMAQISQMMGGSGMPGLGGLGDTGGGAAWPPPDAFGPSDSNATPSSATPTGAAAGQNGGTTPPNPLAQLQQLQQLLGGGPGAGAGAANPWAALGGLGGLGGMGAGSAPPSDARPPEERYATQLEQMQAMGFSDARANLRALLMSGGNVEAAVAFLLD